MNESSQPAQVGSNGGLGPSERLQYECKACGTRWYWTPRSDFRGLGNLRTVWGARGRYCDGAVQAAA